MKLQYTLLALTVAAAPAFASDAARTQAAQVIPLQTSETLYVFKDGTMAKESQFGRAVHLQPSERLTTRDGKQLIAVGNEIARLDYLIKANHGN